MEQLLNDTQEIPQLLSAESLYHDSLEWQLEVALWKQELKFFQKMLDINARHCRTRLQKQKLGHFQNLIIYYDGELLDQFKQQTRRSSKYLAKHIENGSELDHDTYQQRFGGMGGQLAAFASEYRKYKKEFFQFMEEIMEHSVHEPA